MKKKKLLKQIKQLKKIYKKQKNYKFAKTKTSQFLTMWGINKKEQLEKELMKIQAKNGLICCEILGAIALTTLAILIGNDLGITNFITEKINEKIEEYQIEKIQMGLPKKYQNINIILEKPNEEGELTKSINSINKYDYD